MEERIILDVKTKFLRKFGGSAHYGDRQLQWFALLTAVGANLVFWGVLFSYRASGSAIKDSGASVELLRLDASGDESLANWLEYHDPARIGDSGCPSGFTAQLPRREPDLELPAERPRHAIAMTAPAERAFQPLAVSDKPLVYVLAPPRSPARPADGAAPRSPTAVDDRGRNIRIVSEVPPLPLRRVIDDTVLLVAVSGGEPNLLLWRSCGDPVLDGRAAGMVVQGVRELDPPPGYVFIRWPQPTPVGEVAK